MIVGACAAAAAFSVAELSLASLQISSARARRGATLDWLSILFLLACGAGLLSAFSPKLAAARAALDVSLSTSARVREIAAAAAAAVRACLQLSAQTAALEPTAAFALAFAGVSLLVPFFSLLAALKSRAWLIVQCISDVAARGNPLAPTPRVALTFEWHRPAPLPSRAARPASAGVAGGGAEENDDDLDGADDDASDFEALLGALARARAHATFFFPADEVAADKDAWVEHFRLLLAGGHEVGLLGAAGGGGSASAGAATLNDVLDTAKATAKPMRAGPAARARAVSFPPPAAPAVNWFRPFAGLGDVVALSAAVHAGLRVSVPLVAGVLDAAAEDFGKLPAPRRGAVVALPLPLTHVLAGKGGALDGVLAVLAKEGALVSLSELGSAHGEEREAIE